MAVSTCQFVSRKGAKIFKSAGFDIIEHSRIDGREIEWLRRHLDNLCAFA